MITTGETHLPRARSPHRPPSAVLTSLEVRDGATGLTVRRVDVADESDSSPTRESSHAVTEELDAALRANPQWAAPRHVDGELVLHNAASRSLFSSPALLEWRRDLVPSARALFPLQRPWLSRLPSGGAVDERARMLFLDSTDAIGIRTRAKVMRDVVERSTHGVDASADLRWVSLACGAAVPVLDAVSAVPAGRVRLVLVDMDRASLDFAGDLAAAQGLTEGEDFELLERNLVSGVVARTELVEELGEGTAHVVDALGIFEYFSDASCVRLLRNAYRLVAPGGVLVVSNMLSDRPQLALNRRGVGWPTIVPRSVEDLTALVAAAGLPLERTTVHLPQDGVYAVVQVDRG